MDIEDKGNFRKKIEWKNDSRRKKEQGLNVWSE